jgi:hypothetical protein
MTEELAARELKQVLRRRIRVGHATRAVEQDHRRGKELEPR